MSLNFKLYGSKFDVYNDHLPLKSIFNKPLAKAPTRIPCFLLHLQQYDFNMHYLPGKHLKVTDALSRASLSECDPEIPEEELDHHVHTMMGSLPVSSTRIQQFQSETESDGTLMCLTDYIRNGWPNQRKEVEPNIRPFFTHRDDLTLILGITLKGNRIIVPSSMHPEMCKLLHSGHLGIEKTKTRAHSSLYWPNIDNELADAIKSCSVCQEYQLKQKKEPLIPHNVLVVPWSKVGTDLFHLKNKDYIIVVNFTTNYFGLSKLPDTRSSTVIAHTKSIFSKYGIPLEVFSDNCPEFSSHKYKLFSQEYDFKHTKSSPEFPESND